MNNRKWNCRNPYQGNDLKVLCVCSAGLLRSPTMARVLCRTFKNVNPRAVGCDSGHALVPLDEVMLQWADVVLCADGYNFAKVHEMLDTAYDVDNNKEVHCLHLPDEYEFGNPELEKEVLSRLEKVMAEEYDTHLTRLVKM